MADISQVFSAGVCERMSDSAGSKPYWFIFSFTHAPGSSPAVLMTAEGDLPLPKMAAKLRDDEVQFGILRVLCRDTHPDTHPHTHKGSARRAKHVGFTWQGPAATRSTRAAALGVKAALQKYLNGYHVWLEVFDRADLSESLVEARLRTCGGAHAPDVYDFPRGVSFLGDANAKVDMPAIPPPTSPLKHSLTSPSTAASPPPAGSRAAWRTIASASPTISPARTPAPSALRLPGSASASGPHNPSAPSAGASIRAAAPPTMPTKHAYAFDTKLAHFGCQVDATTGAIIPPLHLSTTYERADDLSYPKGYVYSRWGNPTRAALEAAMCDLEGGDAAFAFSSGMAALNAVLQSLPRCMLIYPTDTYHGLRELVRDTFEPWGMQAEQVDMRDTTALEAALSKAAARGFGSGVGTAPLLLHLESPSNPRLFVTDIAACAALGRKYGALVSVDATWMTPLICRPLQLGADMVIHSTTKYLGGHSDVLSGIVICKRSERNDKMIDRLLHTQRIGGAVAAPFDCFLVMRGIRSMGARLRMQCASAARLAEYLAKHPGVKAVHYPGLATHEGHAVAKKQMRLFGAMLAVQVRGGRSMAVEVCNRLQLFTRATSLGGTESLVQHHASVEEAGGVTPDDLLRVSIGLEDVDDLVKDWEEALRAAAA